MKSASSGETSHELGSTDQRSQELRCPEAPIIKTKATSVLPCLSVRILINGCRITEQTSLKAIRLLAAPTSSHFQELRAKELSGLARKLRQVYFRPTCMFSLEVSPIAEADRREQWSRETSATQRPRNTSKLEIRCG